MIACLAIILNSNLAIFVFLTYSVWLLPPVPTFSFEGSDTLEKVYVISKSEDFSYDFIDF